MSKLYKADVYLIIDGRPHGDETYITVADSLFEAEEYFNQEISDWKNLYDEGDYAIKAVECVAGKGDVFSIEDTTWMKG